MKDVIYREVKKSDYEELKVLIGEAFHFHTFIEDAKVLDACLSIYLQSCLAEHTFSSVAEKDGKVIGVILGNCEKEHSGWKAVPYHLARFGGILKLVTVGKKKRDSLKELSKVEVAYGEMMIGREDNFQGSITLFIVGEDCRGLGVGKRLVSQLFEYLAEKEVRGIYLYTDSNCNVGFYDSQGFQRIDVRNVKINQEELGVFLYSYTL